MIHVTRGIIPTALRRAASVERRAAGQFYRRRLSARSKSRFHFKLYRHSLIRSALGTLFLGKCAFCERPAEAQLQVSHFRPMSDAVGRDGTVHHDAYWWLGMEWENMYLSCSDCIKERGTRFPILREQSRTRQPGSEKMESPLLIDPCEDDPNLFLHFPWDGEGVVEARRDVAGGLSERGRVTIEQFGLNRPTLISQRQTKAREIKTSLSKLTQRLALKAKNVFLRSAITGNIARKLASLSDPRYEFAGMALQLIGQWFWRLSKDNQSQLKRVRSIWLKIKSAVSSVDPGVLRTRSTLISRLEQSILTSGLLGVSQWIRRVEIENFKSIKSLDVTFSEPASVDWPWVLLLGENASAKTTFLEAIALTLAGSQYANSLGIPASSFVRRTPSNLDQLPEHGLPGHGSVRVHLAKGNAPIVMSFQQGSRKFTHSPRRPPVLLLGYGAIRLFPRKQNSTLIGNARNTHIRNLFNPFTPLSDPHAWILDKSEVKDDEFGTISVALARLLPEAKENFLWRTETQVGVHFAGRRHEIRELSNGYQTIIALALDIYRGLRHGFKSMEIAEGIVLVDELGEHLHPKWKKSIVADLRKVFPRVQFIVSTHDPLCLRGIRDGEVVLMRRRRDHTIAAVTDLPSIEGMRTDQILTSPFFGLESLYDDSTNSLFKSYFALLGKRKRNEQQARRLIRLRKQVNEIESLGHSPRERLMLKAIDIYLVKERRITSSLQRERVRRRLADELANALVGVTHDSHSSPR
jgi:uncharacterized protein (TIGR02646 family)